MHLIVQLKYQHAPISENLKKNTLFFRENEIIT